MASYMKNPMFGQDDSYDSGWGYDAGGSGATAADWIGLGTQVVDTLGHILQPSAYQQTGGGAYYDQPAYAQPVGGGLPRQGTTSAMGSIDSNVLLLGGLGLAALFLFRKK
jgi:hypothetical protein